MDDILIETMLDYWENFNGPGQGLAMKAQQDIKILAGLIDEHKANEVTLCDLSERLREEIARMRAALEKIHKHSQSVQCTRMARDVLAGADVRKEGVERLILRNEWKQETANATTA